MQRNRATRVRSVSIISIILSLICFLTFVIMGIILRMNQANIIHINPDIFYAIMTAHGLGMAASLFIGAYSSSWYYLSRYVRLSIRLKWIVFLCNLAGFIGLFISTIIGNFGSGWYMLYPLPFILETWHPYTTTLMIFSLAFWGFSWLFIMLDILRAISAKYGVENILGWQYLRKNTKKLIIMKPIVLICAISSVAGISAMFSGANLLILYVLKWENLRLNLDPLLMKNMVFWFGHTLVNITLYYGIGVLYEVLPEYTKRDWPLNKVIIYSWNSTMLLVVGAFLHHMSMDFDQSISLQIIGQISSYLSSVPATAVTVIGVIGQMYKSGVKLSFTPITFFFGIIGWTIGGFAAIVDSTIPVNLTFHNTMWVPGHFHTYFLMGFVLILLGIINHMLLKNINYKESKFEKISIILMTLGGYGFVLMFYIGGVLSVPRRFAEYSYIPIENVKNYGQELAVFATIFSIIFLIGLIIKYKLLIFNEKNK